MRSDEGKRPGRIKFKVNDKTTVDWYFGVDVAGAETKLMEAGIDEKLSSKQKRRLNGYRLDVGTEKRDRQIDALPAKEARRTKKRKISNHTNCQTDLIIGCCFTKGNENVNGEQNKVEEQQGEQLHSNILYCSSR